MDQADFIIQSYKTSPYTGYPEVSEQMGNYHYLVSCITDGRDQNGRDTVEMLFIITNKSTNQDIQRKYERIDRTELFFNLVTINKAFSELKAKLDILENKAQSDIDITGII